MSAEVVSYPDPYDDSMDSTLSEVSTDYLVARRRQYQQELGSASLELNQAQQRYNACINNILRIDEALHDIGYDGHALASELQADVSPAAAVKGYGNPYSQ